VDAQFEVLSPRGDVDPFPQIALNPRLTDLNGATIGLFAFFKAHWALILEEMAKQLQERYPGMKFDRFLYAKDLNPYTEYAEVAKDPDYRPKFEEWAKGVDAVLMANGDAGSCALYLTYNGTFPEHLGKPSVITVAQPFAEIAERAAELRGVPKLRILKMNLLDLSQEFDLTPFVQKVIPERVAEILDQIVDGLTKPLTPEEAAVPAQAENTPRVVTKGTLQEINKYFYNREWCYGMPIMPPTEEAVNEMLTGTDLPRDHVVAVIPPMNGKATVEKIAVNGAMAGCLPTHMPVLIAGVEALVNKGYWLEAYTCSMASWAPLMIVNGRVRNDLALSNRRSLFSPYRRGNAGIAHAMGLMIMNLGGIKAGREDMGMFGHEGHFGICIAENEEDSPWEPLHVYWGFDREDSAITLSWPNTRGLAYFPEEVGAVLKGMCDGIPAFGWDPGCTVVMSPYLAKLLAANGFSRKALVDYLVEYARMPAQQLNVRWLKGNYHEPKTVPLPADPTRSVRKFWSPLHLNIAIAGENTQGLMYYGGGGDHGGPVTAKINLPKNWDELVARYKDFEPAR
jgi:hypothetical protein